MSSFIDLNGDTVWSDADITARTEAMVASVVSAQEQTILARKTLAAQVGAWTLTDDEMALQQVFGQVCAEAHAAGVAAREDNALLAAVLDYEQTGAVPDDASPEAVALVAQRAANRTPSEQPTEVAP